MHRGIIFNRGSMLLLKQSWKIQTSVGHIRCLSDIKGFVLFPRETPTRLNIKKKLFVDDNRGQMFIKEGKVCVCVKCLRISLCHVNWEVLRSRFFFRSGAAVSNEDVSAGRNVALAVRHKSRHSQIGSVGSVWERASARHFPSPTGVIRSGRDDWQDGWQSRGQTALSELVEGVGARPLWSAR